MLVYQNAACASGRTVKDIVGVASLACEISRPSGRLRVCSHLAKILATTSMVPGNATPGVRDARAGSASRRLGRGRSEARPVGEGGQVQRDALLRQQPFPLQGEMPAGSS